MIEQKRKRLHQLASMIAKTKGCNCDLDKWEPEYLTGHSWVCRIHKLAVEAFERPANVTLVQWLINHGIDYAPAEVVE